MVEDDSERISGARARSIEESAGETLIVLDDDCVPSPDYLTMVVDLLDAHPDVLCWGPGTVALDWTGTSPPLWLDARWRTTLFQERSQTETFWSRVRGWPDCYASGVGMVITRAPAIEYARRVRSGHYRAVERSTATVIRGEDAQLLWTAVLLGGAAGSSPRLALRHAVTARRLEPGYLRRLAFGLQESALPCQVEVFGITEAGMPSRVRAVQEVVRTLLRGLLAWRPARRAKLALETAEGLGKLVAVWRVHEAPEPWWLRGLISLAGVR